MIDLVPMATPQVFLDPGKPLRFAVFADDGRRSIGWTLWTGRHTRDVYLTARPLRGLWKMSFHQSGSWHSGLTEELVAAAALPIPSRHLDTWKMPDELAEGVQRSVELVFPDSELRPWPPLPRSNPGERRRQIPHRSRSCQPTRTATTTVVVSTSNAVLSTTAQHSPSPFANIVSDAVPADLPTISSLNLQRS